LENEITDITPRAIIDHLTSERVAWAGRLEEPTRKRRTRTVLLAGTTS
jgi:hypothetical protein